MQMMFFLNDSMRRLCFSPDEMARLAAHELAPLMLPGPEAFDGYWQKHAAAAEVVVTGWKTPPITDVMLDGAPRLKAIIHSAGSVRHLIPDSVWARGIRVATARDALAVGVAETTLGMIIAGLKGFFPAHELLSAGGWSNQNNQLPGFKIRELYNSTIGIIGLSRSGQQLLRLLKQFEVHLIAYDPHISDAEAAKLGVEMVSLEELMRRSDVSSLHAPALPETRHMIRAEHFAVMPDQAIFINTARAWIVDENALIAELERGRIWAFLDVTQTEPLPPRHRLRELPNVVLTPHIAGAVSNGCLRLGRSVVDQVLELAQGKTMHGEITHAVAGIMA